MFSRLCGVGAVLVTLALAAGVTRGLSQTQTGKGTPKGTPTVTTTSTAKAKEVKGIVGKIKDIDLKKKAFSITLTDKSDRTFLVSKETKFLGPRGAEHEEGLRDESMVKGNEVRVVAAKDEKYALEVNLPPWKAGGGKKKG